MGADPQGAYEAPTVEQVKAEDDPAVACAMVISVPSAPD